MWKDISQSLLMKNNKSSFPLITVLFWSSFLHLSITSKWKYGHLEETLPCGCMLYPLLFHKKQLLSIESLLLTRHWFFLKGRGTRDQIANICWLIEKQENSRKTSTSTSLPTLKILTVWIMTNWKIFQEVGILNHLTCLWRNPYAGEEAS